VSSGRKAGDLYLIISARRLSSHLFSNNYSLFLYISHRVVNCCNLYTAFIMQFRDNGSPLPLFNLHSTGHSSLYTRSSGLLSPLCTQNGFFLALLSAPFPKFTTRRFLVSIVQLLLIIYKPLFSVKHLCSFYTRLPFISFILFR
jgi:hypothetical protein